MSSHNASSNRDVPALNRRRLLQGMAATGIAATAGCLGDGGGEEGDPEEAMEREDVAYEDIVEGGTLEFGIERASIGNYDLAESTLADDSMVFAAVYDGLRRADTEGNYYNWMAKEYSATEANDVSFPDDYTEYMESYEIQSIEEGTALFDIGDDNVVLGRHPDDVAQVGDGLTEGDDMRLLTREESGDAVADGTFGTKVEGSFHEGIEFHNGEECTASNLVGSYDRFAGSANEGQIFDSFLYAEATDGDDGYDFALYSQQADAIAETNLPPFAIFPSDHMDIAPGELDPRGGGPEPIGTGAYEVESYAEGEELLLSRTDNYWVEEIGLENMPWYSDDIEGFPARPPIEEINIRFNPEAGQRVAALQDGSIDLAYSLPAADYTSFQQDDQYSEYRVTAATSTGFLFTQFSNASGGAYENKEVRQAYQQMIPRQDIVEVVEEGWATPAQVPLPAPAAGVGSTMSYEELNDQDWAYPLEAKPDEAEGLINDAGVDTPIDTTLETNADDAQRQDKVELIVGEMNDSGLFEAEMETPADINPWYLNNLVQPNSHERYAEEQRTATIGLAAGFDPHGYAKALHHPDNFNGCCNFFHPEGTFDWIDTLDSARFGVDVAQDTSLRGERYDDVWPEIADDVGNTMIDFSLTVAVGGPALNGFNAYPDRRGFLNYSLYGPYDDQVAYLDR